MAEKVIGVDIGTNAVRAAEVAVSDNPTLLHFGQVGLPPGAVVEGEVADPDAVAAALRRLWKEVGFKSRSVRVGIASARVILRMVDVPALSDEDTTSALRLQLSDYVPLDPDATVFDFEPLADLKTDEGPQRRLLLAAAHVDAVRPLARAVKLAGLKLAAVDVVPAALARSVRAVVEPGEEPPVEAIVSLGAGVTVVVVAKAGVPMFARTVTNIAGRHVTEVIAAQMDVSTEEAEGYKRGAVSGTTPGLVARAQLAARPVVEEIVAEIRDSLGYYLTQPGAVPVERVALAGGGALLPTVGDLLHDRLGVPVELADPFARLRVGSIGFERKDQPFLAPFLPVAVGIALGGGGRSRSKRINLTPVNPGAMSEDKRRQLIACGVAAALMLGVSALYVHRRGEISSERSKAEAIATQIATLQNKQAAEAAAAGTAVALRPADRRAVVRGIVASAHSTDIDWVAVATALDQLGAPLGIKLSSFQGAAATQAPGTVASPQTTSAPVASSARSVAKAASAAAAQTDAVTGATEPSSATLSAEAKANVATVTLAGTAPDLPAIAAWIDAVNADPRFANPWVPSTTRAETAAAAGGKAQSNVTFTAQLQVTGTNLVKRQPAEVAKP